MGSMEDIAKIMESLLGNALGGHTHSRNRQILTGIGKRESK